ncbi:ABC transporter ATP-binding protein [Staphylococcus epidermidis]|nr:ABC transporter ATP-binding protein [Staphylococcus epidermidis]MBM0765232.1 ABC transporter ATP-binding protein [Staphylococcus epidermidis]MBM0787180.1 ABC transporter ATP-binding protein [Staphylococcus epidermidis]MBM0789507.1 ABC transporter ATP-binding protein [Staphylococcus epidermidis]MCG8946602.1 ABC transporter ATP-binding protein [Staphylococcus epidermidis]
MSLIGTSFSLYIPLIIRNALNKSSLSTDKIVIIIICFGLTLIFSGVSTYILGYIGQKIIQNIRSVTWNKVIKLSYSFHLKNSASNLTSRLVNDTMNITRVFSEELSTFLTNLFSVIVSLIFLYIINKTLTLYLVCTLPILIIVILPIGNIMKRVSSKSQEATAKLSSYYSNRLSTIKLIKTLSTYNIEKIKNYTLLKNIFDIELHKIKVLSFFEPIMNLILFINIFGILFLGYYLMENNMMKSGDMFAYVLYLFQIINPIVSITSYWTEVQRAIGSSDRILKINKEPEEVLTIKTTYNNFVQKMEINDLNFRKDNKQIINSISLDLHKGYIYNIIGESGCGKSTLLNILAGLNTEYTGNICLDKLDKSQFSKYEWRNLFSYITQDLQILEDTVYNNLIYGINENISIEEIQNACKKTNSLNFIQNLKNGFSTSISPDSINLSIGQKQRLVLTRAFLQKKPIILLDEVTSNLDKESHKYIVKSIESLAQSSIVLNVTHRHDKNDFSNSKVKLIDFRQFN